jgi:hypothetical protein
VVEQDLHLRAVKDASVAGEAVSAAARECRAAGALFMSSIQDNLSVGNA